MSARSLRAGPEPRARRWAVLAERGALLGMGLGLALMLALDRPWAFRAGFFVVLGATVAQIVFGHLRASDP